MRAEGRRIPAQREQRLVQRARLGRIADHDLDAENVLHEVTEMAQLFVEAYQAIQTKNRVDNLVPDLLLRLDAADALVDAPLGVHRGLVLNEIGDEAGAAPGRSISILETLQLPVTEIEVRL